MVDAPHSDIKVIVAAHKPYWMPDDPMYLPVHVGAVGKDVIEGYQRDDAGENISVKNPRYCELTGIYWAWKNLDADHVGLAHYRRHFKGHGERGVLTSEEAQELVDGKRIILPKKRNYYIESVGSHYAHTFDQAHLDILRDVMQEQSPEATGAFDAHMQERSAHIWNMAIMPKSVLDAYCAWMFPILEKVEERIDFSGMTPFEERVIGRLSERMLDPWIHANDVPFVEVPVVSLEGEKMSKKVVGVLAAKFLGKKYDKSF